MGASSEQLGSTEVRAIGASLGTVVLGVLPLFLTGALGIFVARELQLDKTALAVALAVGYATAGVASPIAGRLTEWLEPRLVLRFGLSLAAVSLLGVALAARSWRALVGALAVGGGANAFTQVATNTLLFEGVRDNRHGVAFAAKQCAIFIGTALAGLSVPAIALTIGWRWAYAIAATVIPAMFVWLPSLKRTTPRMVARSVGVRPLTLAAGIGFGTASTTTIGAWYVTTLVHAKWSPGVAGLLFAAGSALGLGARLVVGVAADKKSTDELARVAKMQIGGAIACLIFATGHRPSLALATPLAFMAGWGWTGLFNLAVVRAYPHAPGAATGVTQAGNYVGHVVGNLAFGLVADHWGLGSAWLVSAAFALTGSMFIVVARRRRMVDRVLT